MLQSFFHDKHGNLVIWQKPNAPLIGWIVFAVASRISSGHLHALFRGISMIFLAVWALLEVFAGVNYFRRLLGLTVLLVIVGSLFLGPA